MIKYIILSILVLSIFATKSDQTNYQLKQIESTSFGKKLLDTIQLQLSDSNLVDNTFNLLNNLRDELTNEQKEDDARHEELQQSCEHELQQLDEQISTAQTRSNEIALDIETKSQVKGQKELLLGEYETEKNDLLRRIRVLEEESVQIEAYWAAAQDDHDKASYTIMRAKEIIYGEYRRDQSFLEIPTKNLIQVSAHFQSVSTTHEFKKKSLNGIFKVLGQIASATPIQADPLAVQKILDICDEILEKLDESLASERSSYYTQRDDNKRSQDTANDHLTNLDNSILDLNREISLLVSHLNQARSDKEFQDGIIKDSQEQKQLKEQYCSDQVIQYQQRSKQRKEELDIIVQVFKILSEQEQSLRRFINSRS